MINLNTEKRPKRSNSVNVKKNNASTRYENKTHIEPTTKYFCMVAMITIFQILFLNNKKISNMLIHSI